MCRMSGIITRVSVAFENRGVFLIEYISSLENISDEMLFGFFVGWPNPPSPSAHMRILEGSYCIWLAIDKDIGRVVGFINAISDGVLSAYIPLLEVLPEYQNAGIGKELVERMLGSLKNLYMVDLLCDEDLLGYYAKFGMNVAIGSILRNYDRQSCE